MTATAPDDRLAPTTVPPPKTVRQLAAAANEMTREAFAAAHPWPSLVIPHSFASQALAPREEGTPDTPFRFRTLAGRTSPVERLTKTYADALVIPVVKSGRNPFDGSIMVGRARNNDIVLPHETVSKAHAYFDRRADGVWRIHDNGSTNGIVVCGVPLPSRRSTELMDGVEILFGPEVLGLWKMPGGLHDVLRLVARCASL